MTWYDQIKYKEFSRNADEYLKKKHVIHFDIIHAQYRGRNRQYLDRHYQTVSFEHVKKMLQKEEKVLAACFCSDRKDLFVEKN